MKKYIITLLVIGCITATGFGLMYYGNHLNNNKVIDSITINASSRYFDQELLVNESDLAVKGTIEKVSEAKWNTADNKKPSQISGNDIIYRDIEFKVSEVLKGNNDIDKKIVIRTYGGTVEGFTVRYNPEINFMNDEEVIIFLTIDDTPYNKMKSREYYRIKGGIQGVYRVSGEEVQNVHEKLNVKDFKEKTQKFMLNPIVKDKNKKSDE